MPPTPTVPIKVPATNAVNASSIESNLAFQEIVSRRLQCKRELFKPSFTTSIKND